MNNFIYHLSNYLENNKLIKKYHNGFIITGKDSWEITIETSWRSVGRIRISSFELSDIWALRDWWQNSLNYKDKYFYSLFPSGYNLEKAISNHYKKHENHKNITFNAWLIKENCPMEYLFNEIISHFFLLEINSEKPYIGIGIGRNYKSKKLGILFMLILLYTMKILDRKTLWLTVDKNNDIGHNLYKKIGFKDIGEIESNNFSQGFKTITQEYAMKIDLNKFN